MNSTDLDDLQYREPDVTSEVTQPLARALREARASICYRWLERIEERVEVAEEDIFPSEELLDHVPLLIEAVADFMEDPGEEGPAADEVMAKAAELGEMRFEQGFSTYQILKEFDILGGVIFTFLQDRVTELGFTPEADDIVRTLHRVYRALAKVQQATAARHIAMLERQRRDLDQRLRLIDTVLGESLRAPVEAALEDGPESAAAAMLTGRLEDARRLTDTGRSSRRQGVPLAGAVKEAVRRVRPIAQDSGLEIAVREEELPDVKVPDAEVEQCLVVYLTNAIRHCVEADGECRVEVGAELDGSAGEVVIRVLNTGSPINPTDDITTLAIDAEVSGRPDPGVGLRFARDLIASLGGRTWAYATSRPGGAVFALALPSRRSDDTA